MTTMALPSPISPEWAGREAMSRMPAMLRGLRDAVDCYVCRVMLPLLTGPGTSGRTWVCVDCQDRIAAKHDVLSLIERAEQRA